MPQVVSKFKAFIDVEDYDESADQGAYAATRLQLFSPGEVSWEPIPKAPYLPASRLRVKAFIRHKKVWLSSDEGADALWQGTLSPWLHAKLPELQKVVEKTNSFRIERGRAPIDFRNLEVEVPPYVFQFPCSDALDYGEKAGLIDRFRLLANASGALADARPRIKSVEMPWQDPEALWAKYDAHVAALARQAEEEAAALRAEASDDEFGGLADLGESASEGGSFAPSEEGEQSAIPKGDTVALLEAEAGHCLAASAPEAGVLEESNGEAGATAALDDARENAGDFDGESAPEGGSPHADADEASGEVPDGDCADGECPEPIDYRLWKVTFIDGSSRLFDSEADEWVQHDFGADPVREVDEEETRACLERAANHAKRPRKPLLYSDVRLHPLPKPEPDRSLLEEKFCEFGEKRALLEGILEDMGGVAIAVSGGINSCILALEAKRVLGKRARLLFAGGAPHLPQGRMERMRAFEEAFDIEIEHVDHPCATDSEVRRNTYLICYNRRRAIFEELEKRAKESSLPFIAQGENADVASGIGRGRRAARELGVRSPLAEAGLTGEDMEIWARMLGLPQLDTPDDSCMASRYGVGAKIDDAALGTLDELERAARELLGAPSILLFPEKEGIVSMIVDDGDMHGLMGHPPNAPILYRELTRLGNEWTEPSSEQQCRTLGASAEGQSPDAAAEEQDVDGVSSCELPYLGEVLKELFQRIKRAGFDTVLVEDRLESKVRREADDPWWIDRPRRVNASGRS